MSFLRKNKDLIILFFSGILIFTVGATLAKRGVSDLEEAIFLFFNGMSDSLHWPFWIFSQFGTLGVVLLLSALFLIIKQKTLSMLILIGGLASYALAYGLKQFDFRARPGAVLLEANVREGSNATLGFPSGHAAVATILCLLLLVYLPKKWRPYLIVTAMLVMLSRLYLGVHLPLDLIGGFGIGLSVFSLLMMVKRNLLQNSHEAKIDKALLKKIDYRSLLLVIVLGLAVLFIMSRYEDFKSSIESLKDANLWLVGLAIIFSMSTYFFASMSYKSLVYHKIKLAKMFVVQLASSFASKLAPAGAGGLALNTRFLTLEKHSVTQAASIAAINNIMGLVGHMSILLLVALFGASSISEAFNIHLSFSPLIISVIIGMCLAIIAVLAASPKLRDGIISIGGQVKNDFLTYKRHPVKILGSYASSMCITLCYTGALYASAHALGSDLSPLQILVVFTAGIAAATVTPTPGGVGGVEAALVASLKATGMETSLALAITLLYRLATYWLPIVPGFISFQYCLRRKYI